MKETLLLAFFPTTLKKSNLLVKSRKRFTPHLVPEECRAAFCEEPAQSQFKLGSRRLRNACNRPSAEKKRRQFPFDLTYLFIVRDEFWLITKTRDF